MSFSARIAAALAVCAVHLLVLAPRIGGWSVIVEPGFAPQAEAILDGALPYREIGFEYPPLALGPLLAPALLAADGPGYVERFNAEMLGFDLAIVLLLALALRASARRVWGALLVYSAGIVALSGFLLPESLIDAALPLSRFDLVPAALVLAAVLAREAGRSATWSGLLALAVAVKGFAVVLYPPLLRGERRPLRVAVAAVPPLLAAAAVVVVSGDDFASALGYHAERELHIESVAATPLLLAHALGAPAGAENGAGSLNLTTSGADAARTITVLLLALAYALVVWAAWRSGAPPLHAATAVLAVALAFAPVLSPQFLIWLLPLSAAAFGLRLENATLVAAVVLTQLTLHHYPGIDGISTVFIALLALRNLLLLSYAALVCVPLLAPALRMRAVEAT